MCIYVTLQALSGWPKVSLCSFSVFYDVGLQLSHVMLESTVLRPCQNAAAGTDSYCAFDVATETMQLWSKKGPFT